MLKWAPARDVLYKMSELKDGNHYLITKDVIGTYLVKNLVKDCCYGVLSSVRQVGVLQTYRLLFAEA
jgi:hypothetical protein